MHMSTKREANWYGHIWGQQEVTWPVAISLHWVSGDDQGLQSNVSEPSTPPTLKHPPATSWEEEAETGAFQHPLEKKNHSLRPTTRTLVRKKKAAPYALLCSSGFFLWHSERLKAIFVLLPFSEAGFVLHTLMFLSYRLLCDQLLMDTSSMTLVKVRFHAPILPH